MEENKKTQEEINDVLRELKENEEKETSENIEKQDEIESSEGKKSKREIKINLKTAIIIICIIIIAICLIIGIYIETTIKDLTNNSSTTYTNSNSTHIIYEIEEYKPIIYLYPEEETEVTVTLGNSDLITCSYPKYTDEWNVLAYPNGDLIDLDTNRTLYSLYYESTCAIEFKIEDEGFIVAGEDTAEFLEEKLELLGLNQREAEEFIIYWLPILQENEYNYIRFATYDEIEANMPLEINPEPDTLIRVLMTYKGLDEPIEVEEQILETPERTGFVAVEWGGTEIEYYIRSDVK